MNNTIKLLAAATAFAVSSVSIARAQVTATEWNPDSIVKEDTFRLDVIPEKPSAPSSDWRFEMNSWTWMMGVTGDVGVRKFTTNVDADFADILEKSDSIFGYSAHIEVGKDKWGGYVDFMYAKLGADNQSGPKGVASVDVEFEQAIVDFGLMYRLAMWDAGTGSRRDATVDAYGGGRFNHIWLQLNPDQLETRSRDQNWIDPIVGAKVLYPFARNWHVVANADIGGFGAASQLTWSATAVLGYDFRLFNHDATFYAGYRAISWDYDEDNFKFDVIQHGPLIGFSFKW